MKKLLKKLLPERVILFYHYLLALLATVVYGWPAKKMVVIGITGTKGKTSTANFIWSVLTSGGHKTGIITTANVRIGEQEMINARHMTMPGRLVIQRTLAQMARAGCEYAVVETTSEGLKQHRNVGVYYDWAIFTNLTPEHLQSHGGSFENYKKAKGQMFARLKKHEKQIKGRRVEKIIMVNQDSEHAYYYLNFEADKKITYGWESAADYQARAVEETRAGVNFLLAGEKFSLRVLGKFNVYNALPAIIVGHLAGINNEDIRKGLAELKVIPGRMEKIEQGQKFIVLVDYAHEKESLTRALETGRQLAGADGRVIILTGAQGGGRDQSKRAEIGAGAARLADLVVVANEDPYEDDPQEILEEIAQAAERAGKVRGRNLFVFEDRREGIRQALSLAQEKDVVIIAGKGAEQTMIVKGGAIPWDERAIVREELQKII